MKSIKHISIDGYNYNLPNHRIARYPLKDRDQSKLLISKNGYLSDDLFRNIGYHLPTQSLLITNETKVIQARLQFRKVGGAAIELFCLEPIASISDFQLAFSHPSPVVWKCLVGNSKRWKKGILEKKLDFNGLELLLTANRTELQADYSIIEFSWNNPSITFAQVLESCGEIPLPPYLNRPAEAADKLNYQTIFAHHEGSVAAPTAGLHFTASLINKLQNDGFTFAKVTLHIGVGTFRPVTSNTIGEHNMHAERISVSKSLISQFISISETPIIPVGTTSLRTVESLYWIGLMLAKNNALRELHLDQWYPYQINKTDQIATAESLQYIIDYLNLHKLDSLTASTALMIAPGYPFKIANGLITNFHQPKSTLLLLVAALLDKQWEKAYQYALSNDFRFLSYGDSCLFLP